MFRFRVDNFRYQNNITAANCYTRKLIKVPNLEYQTLSVAQH